MKKARTPRASSDTLGRRGFLTFCASGLVLPHLGYAQSSKPDAEGGIGGTGIVGLVTELNALSVGGSQFRFDANTVYSDASGVLSKDSLALGDSVTIEAAGPAEARVARRVHITHPLVGRIADLSKDGRRFSVNGVEVRLQTKGARYPTGTRVAVSGLWQGTRVIATRLSPARDTRDLISGDVSREIRASYVGPTRVTGQNIGRVADGSFVSALGRFDPGAGRFVATSFENARFTGAAGPLKRLLIEGYLEPSDAAPGFRVSGLGHSFARNLDLSAFANKKALFSGSYTGRFDARRGVVLPEQFEQQRRFLRTLTL